ncbi:unnamed protein product [Urochloa humidicola]
MVPSSCRSRHGAASCCGSLSGDRGDGDAPWMALATGMGMGVRDLFPPPAVDAAGAGRRRHHASSARRLGTSAAKGQRHRRVRLTRRGGRLTPPRRCRSAASPVRRRCCLMSAASPVRRRCCPWSAPYPAGRRRFFPSPHPPPSPGCGRVLRCSPTRSVQQLLFLINQGEAMHKMVC